jgi:hypothetical protein
MRRLHQILKGESTFDELLLRHRTEAVLQDRVHRVLPPALARHVTVIDARSGELELGAASGAVAALLRQRAPELNIALAREGFEFTGIRVRVQARLAREAAQKLPKKQMDSASTATVLALARQLGDSPLATALRRLGRLGSEAGVIDNSSAHASSDPVAGAAADRRSPDTGSGGRNEPLEGVEDQNPEQ